MAATGRALHSLLLALTVLVATVQAQGRGEHIEDDVYQDDGLSDGVISRFQNMINDAVEKINNRLDRLEDGMKSCGSSGEQDSESLLGLIDGYFTDMTDQLVANLTSAGIGCCDGASSNVIEDLAPRATACMPPYEKNRQLGCVYISKPRDKVTWRAAKVKCEDMGAQLIVNPPLEELLHYTTEKKLRTVGLWIGGKHTGDGWTWLDGDGTYIEEGWNQNEPDLTDITGCVYFNWNGEGLLNDHRCSEKKRYMCEYPKSTE